MNTRTVETSRAMAASPRRVVESFLDGDELAGWWKVSRSLVDATPGGVWAIAWDRYGDAATNHSWTGVIRELGEGRLVIDPLVQNEGDRPLFGPLELEIDAVADDEGSRLTVRHHGYRRGEHWDWLHDAVVRGWAAVLDDLADWLAVSR